MRRKGSMTLEAAVIVPCILIVTAALMILTFSVHNRNYYMASACESDLVGNARYPEDRDMEIAGVYARERAEERIGEQSMPGSRPENILVCDPVGTETTYQGQTFPMFPKEWFDFSVKIRVRRIWPTEAIRKARAFRKALEELS